MTAVSFSNFTFARTVNPAAPFVIGQQLYVEPDGAPQRRVSFIATSAEVMSPVEVTDFASSRSLIRRLQAAPNPRRLLKDRVADDWRAASVDGSGYALVWREGERIRGAWLDAGYRLVGGVWQVNTNDSRSAPDVRMQGNQGVLLFATRQQPTEGSPYRVAAVPLRFGTVPEGFSWLPISLDDARTDHVAPSLAPLLGRGWLVSFTVRPRRDVSTLPPEEQTDAVHIQAFDLQLRPAMRARVAMARSRDAELVTAGQRFLLVSFATASSSRVALAAVPGRCDGL